MSIVSRAGRLSVRIRRASVVEDVGVPVVKEVVRDRVSGLAAEVAFYGILSVFPGLLMLAAALGSLDSLAGSDVAQHSQDLIIDFMQRILTDRASPAVDAARGLFEDHNSGMLAVGALLALWSLSRGFAATVTALNIAYGAEERRPWLRVRATGLVMALGSVVLAVGMLALVVMGPFLGFGREIASAIGNESLFSTTWALIRFPLMFAVLILWATTLYHFAPSRRTAWRADLPGAAVAALIWIVVSIGFSAYLRLAAGGNQIFGILGGGLILMFWLYLLSFGLLVGAELNQVLEERSKKSTLHV